MSALPCPAEGWGRSSRCGPEPGSCASSGTWVLAPAPHRPGYSPPSSPSAAKGQGTTVVHRTVSYTPEPLPARHFDTDTTEPVSFYLSSLEELLAWKPTRDDDFNVAATPLAARQPPLHSKRPRTLVCHDMKGGYLEDRFIQGSAARSPYVFYHWQYIDIFVYFSHHVVTIPPVGWTNAAHRNGVSVLGTFITEWTEGRKTCESFLAGQAEAYSAVAKQLARIASFYRFDGWLVNIENELSEAAVRTLPLFLRQLKEQLGRLVPGGLVLWYDSVLRSGQLKWQNELNEENRVFFDACDGLFTNYNWKEEHLERTRAQAGERWADVYVGIDVFARGDVVGGGFDTDKSLRLIRKHGLSAALFAPGWVYEHLGATDFLPNEDKFWGLLTEQLSTHSIGTLPLHTSFNLGMGTRRFSSGQEVVVSPWYNLSAQEIQPLFTEHQGPGGGLRTHCCLRDAWEGGSSLLVAGAIPPDIEHVAVRLFSFQTPAPPKLFLSLLYKLEEPQAGVTVALELATRDSGSCRVGDIEPTRRHQPRPLPGPPPGLSTMLSTCGEQSTQGWTNQCYELELQDCALHELSLVLARRPAGPHETPFSCRLGEIWVLDADVIPASPPLVRHLEASQLRWRRGPGPDELLLSLTLRWAYPASLARGFRIHNQRAAEPQRLLGLAYAPLYRAVDVPVPVVDPGQSGTVVFLVEPVLPEGFPVEPAALGHLLLGYSSP
ncbi:cytosolic endo-beta-N-acetylglucosaminidase [Alligator sinensis]|uniref:Cytosolic endo-beta-N-acetylglucosaminidase n=1 Tax=Alligator sinensis TaxID=38654 RepID=A0A1U8DXC1_ALLSI|nr:cytosolic endo-beta-N-acetylglucosaminidase [Alligator sinensis]